MKAFRKISEKMARRIDRAMLGLAGTASLQMLETNFLEVAGKLLPADCMCWNNWQRDWSGIISHRCAEEEYSRWFGDHLELFGQVVGHHPVIANGSFSKSTEQVLRVSDFQCYGSFKENPLFREIYRHMDSHFQVAYTPCLLSDRRIVLTWNRRAMDFENGDQEVFQYLGDRLGVICRRIDERQRLEENWRTLSGFVGAQWSAGPVSSLGERDVRLLAELMKGRSRASIARKSGIRVDSVDKRLGAIRERLGMENHHQLLCALAELRFHNVVGGSRVDS
jgi:DNA-binding CsgD family transcriptional regulator